MKTKNVKRVAQSGNNKMPNKMKRKPKTSPNDLDSLPLSERVCDGRSRSAAKAMKKFLRDAGVEGADGGERQCFGPQCINGARPYSNYCSDECGLRLATKRLETLLPKAVADFRRKQPVADQLAHKRLDEIRQKSIKHRERLQNLCAMEGQLQVWTRQAKMIKCEQEDDVNIRCANVKRIRKKFRFAKPSRSPSFFLYPGPD